MDKDQELKAGLKNVERFERVLRVFDTETRERVRLGSEDQVIKLLQEKGFLNPREVLKIRRDYFAYRNIQMPGSPTPGGGAEKTGGQGHAPGAAGSTAGLLLIARSYLNSPDRYSAERLEKQAHKHAEEKIKALEKDARKDKKTLTDAERKAAFNKAKIEFHENYVASHEARARELNNDPKTNNPLLKRALFYKDAKTAIATATAAAKKDKEAKYSDMPQQVYSDAKMAIAEATTEARKDKSALYSDFPRKAMVAPIGSAITTNQDIGSTQMQSNTPPATGPSRPADPRINRNSGVDTVNSMLRKSNSAISDLKKAQQAANLLKKLQPFFSGIGIQLIILFVILFGFTFLVSNIIGGGANTGGGSDQPDVIYFTGGKAYLSCDKTQPVKCPEFNQDSKITIYAIFYVDDTFPADLISNAKITIGPFSKSLFDVFLNNIQPRPDVSFFSPNYTWKLSTVLKNAEKGPDTNEYVISMGVGKPLTAGKTTITLSLEGFPIIDTGGGNTANTCKDLIYTPVLEEGINDRRKGSNYGDPRGNYSDKNFKTYLCHTETKHPDLIPFWFDIANTEGGVNSNSGGCGRFQMGPTNWLGTCVPTHNPPFPQVPATQDAWLGYGDVPWQRQIQYAVSTNNYLLKQNNNFGYWGTAMCLCYFDYYRNADGGKWCKDIITKGKKYTGVRCPRECFSKKSCSGPTDDMGKKNGGNNKDSSIDCSKYSCYDYGDKTYHN